MLLALASLAVAVGTLPSPPWGVDGHRLICQLAWERLTPAGRQYVTGILAADSLPTPFVDSCIWADTVRATVYPETRAYHSRLRPKEHGHPDLHLVCAPPQVRCGPWAIRYYLQALVDSQTPPQRRAEALKFLAHFVGDVHQPLHEGHLADRGGRDTPVDYYGLREPNGHRISLHRVWDDALFRRTELSFPAALSRLRAGLATNQVELWERAPLVDWIREAEALVDTVVYPLPPGHRLDRSYEARAVEVVTGQLERAAARLAYLVNQLADGTLNLTALEAM